MSGALPPDILKLLRALEPKMRSAVLAAIARLASNANLDTLVEAIQTGMVSRVESALGLSLGNFSEINQALSSAFASGGYQAAKSLPRFSGLDLSKVLFQFSSGNPRAEAWVSREAGRLITGIITQQREVIRLALEGGIKAGRGPRTIALDLVGRVNSVTKQRTGGLIGLNKSQATAAARAREELAGSPQQLRSYLSRELRDKRYDAAVRKAIASGKPLPKALADKIHGRYADRLLKHRADVISRTETLNALRSGRKEGYMQLRDTGKVSDSQFQRTWRSSGSDGRTRDDHLAIDGQRVVGLDAPFTFPDGSKCRHPGDDSLGAPAEQLIQCRCFEEVRITKAKAA